MVKFALPTNAPAELSAEDLTRAREQARAKVEKEIRDKLFEAALEAAENEARLEAGLAPKSGPTKLEPEKVKVTLNLPESVTPVPALKIDTKLYYDRQTYDVSPSTAMQIHDMQARAWENDDRMSRGREKDRYKPKPVLIGADGSRSLYPQAMAR